MGEAQPVATPVSSENPTPQNRAPQGGTRKDFWVVMREFFSRPLVRDFLWALGAGLLVTMLLGVIEFRVFFSPVSLFFDRHEDAKNYWQLAQGARKWAHFQLFSFFDGNIFFPLNQSLAFDEHVFLPSLIVALFKGLGAPVLGIVHAVSFGLVGLSFSCFLWTMRVLGVGWAPALLGSVFFAWNSYTWSHLSNAAMLWTWPYPILALSAFKFLKERKLAWFYTFLAVTAVLALSSKALFTFALVPILIVSVLFARIAHRERTYRQNMAIWGFALVVLLLIFYRPYLMANRIYGFDISVETQIAGSGKWLSLFLPGGELFWGTFFSRKPVVPGIYLGLLGLLGMISALTLLVIRWSRIKENKTGGGLALPIGLMTAAVFISFGVMGPRAEGDLLNFNVWRLFGLFPGFENIRTPAALSICVFLVFGALLTWFGQQLLQTVPASRLAQARLGIFAFAGLLAIEFMPASVGGYPKGNVKEIDSLAVNLAGVDAKAPVVLLPLKEVDDWTPTFAASLANPMVNGIGPEWPAVMTDIVIPALEHCIDRNCTAMLRSLSVKLIILRTQGLEAHPTVVYLSKSNEVERISSENGWDIYQLKEHLAPRKLVAGNQGFLRRLVPWQVEQCQPPKDVKASERSERVSMVMDGMFGTQWQTAGNQSKGQWVDVVIPEGMSGDLVVETESGFDGDVRNGMFLRNPSVAWVSKTQIAGDQLGFARLYLKEPLKIVQQFLVSSKADKELATLRISAGNPGRINANWAISEVRVCRYASK